MTPSTETVAEALRFIDLAGVLANAVLGGMAARSARLDIVGFVILAIMSGLGGGMIRDTLLQHGTPVALTDPAYLIFAVAGGAIAFFIPLRGRWSQRSLVLLDAFAVGCWAAAGAQKALDVGLWWLPAIMLGVITAVGGGMVRDIMLMKVPTIFGGNTLYATSALLASVEMVVFNLVGRPASARWWPSSVVRCCRCWLAGTAGSCRPGWSCESRNLGCRSASAVAWSGHERRTARPNGRNRRKKCSRNDGASSVGRPPSTADDRPAHEVVAGKGIRVAREGR